MIRAAPGEARANSKPRDAVLVTCCALRNADPGRAQIVRHRQSRLYTSGALRKTDVVWLAAILVIAAALRVWAPWDDVLGPSTSLRASGARVNFLETDAWYHVRLVENQVRNFPHRVTVDPYAAP